MLSIFDGERISRTSWQQKPIIAPPTGHESQRFATDGQSFFIHEWKGSGPAICPCTIKMTKAWHILEGTVDSVSGQAS